MSEIPAQIIPSQIHIQKTIQYTLKNLKIVQYQTES
jgi:hypothetical protein